MTLTDAAHRPPDETASERSTPNTWWADSVAYQISPRSFADSDGDGVGDLEGIRGHLGYLELIGVQSIWLGSCATAPVGHDGEDLTDTRSIDPVLGSLEHFDALVTDVHQRGMRLILDLVPNHVSVEHPWFSAALQAPRGDPARRRFVFRDGRGTDGAQPPNNWTAVDGGPAWTRTHDGQWYLHLFGGWQPDLDWTSLDVWSDLEETLRFWLDRGVDGFRVRHPHAMAKPSGLPDRTDDDPASTTDPRFDNQGVHDVHRFIRRVLDSYSSRLAVGDFGAADPASRALYERPDELHQTVGAPLSRATFDAATITDLITAELSFAAEAGTTAVWTLAGAGPSSAATPAVERHRARAMLLLAMALPGTVSLLSGDELGLAGVGIGDASTLPWDADDSTGLADLSVERQLEDPDSTLSLVRQAVELRIGDPSGGGATIDWYGAPQGCLAFRRQGGLICALNAGSGPIDLPPGRLLLASQPLVDDLLPPGAAAWLS